MKIKITPLIVFIILILGWIGIILFTGNILSKTEFHYNPPRQVIFPDPLEVWIDDLVGYECGEPCAESVTILDVNGLHSYGCLQFQAATFVSFIERYDMLPLAEPHEYMNLILDCSLQKKLARLMILEDHDNWRHWWTSVTQKGLGEPPEM